MALSLALWSLAAAGGFAFLNAYAGTPGGPLRTPTQWPPTTALALAREQPSLLLFLHPRCGCSGASLEEFSRLLALRAAEVSARIVFVQPPGMQAENLKGPLWDHASRLPEVEVLVDEDGVEAQRFGVQSSGSTLLFAPSGELLFCGGITIARGHAGDNPGRTAIVEILSDRSPLTRDTPVFGCPLLEVAALAAANDALE